MNYKLFKAYTVYTPYLKLTSFSDMKTPSFTKSVAYLQHSSWKRGGGWLFYFDGEVAIGGSISSFAWFYFD